MTKPTPLVFLDASSGEPLLPEARQAWLAVVDAGWGDPIGLHRPARLAAQALDQARASIAAAVGARSDEVVFTTSGTQANQAAISGLALGRRRIGSRIIHSAIDHSSVLDSAKAYGEPVIVPVDHLGRTDSEIFTSELVSSGTALACLQVANHEVGTIQPYREVAQAAADAGVPLILDASSALGRIDLHDAGPWSILTASAHSFGGPASVGIMVIRKGTRWRPPYPTDDYQSGYWPGQPDVAAIVAAAIALQTWESDREQIARTQFKLIDQLRSRIAASISDVDIAGDSAHRLPHLLTFSALYVDGETLTLELDKAGFAVASGSACSANSEQPSHVLAAMGALTHGNVRIGLTRTTSTADIDAFLAALSPTVASLRATLEAL